MYKQPCQPERVGASAARNYQPHSGSTGEPPADMWSLNRPELPSTPRYEGAFRAAYDRLAVAATHLEQSRLTARSLLAELVDQPPPRRRLLLANSNRFRSWGLVEQILVETANGWFEQPGRAIEWAELALLIVDQLYPLHGERMVSDLAGRVWAHLATAHLSAGNLDDARFGFEQAKSKLAMGTGDPFEEAQLLELRVAYSLATGALTLALEQLAEIERISIHIEEPAMAYRALLNQAELLALPSHRTSTPTPYAPASAASSGSSAPRRTSSTAASHRSPIPCIYRYLRRFVTKSVSRKG